MSETTIFNKLAQISWGVIIKRAKQKRLLTYFVFLNLSKPLPEMCPGQFVEVKVEHEPNTMLRRPISINFVDRDRNELWLLVAMIGNGTRQLGNLQAGDYLNCVLPLGNGFSMPAEAGQKFLLVGGGVGVAPLLYFGKCIKDVGAEPIFLLGARKATDLLELDEFAKIGRVCITTATEVAAPAVETK